MLKIGSVIDGKYKILYQIGKGGMSTVYLAINESAGKQWAVKEVRKSGKASDEVIRQNLLTEINILKRLHHPHLPSIIDVIDRDDDTYLILMDYVEGQTLKKLLDQKGAQPEEAVVDWAIQLCSVLSYLHAQDPPIIYRDMKPANIMLKPDGNVVLIDFGTAREYKAGSTEDTTCLGTRGYAAPEQYGGIGQTDARTDIYNLGATMYHLVTGHNPTKPPYEIRPIREWDPSLSSGLERIILKCTQSDPKDRYQTADELRFALEHYTELDDARLKAHKRKWHAFTAMCALSVLFLAGSAGTRIYAGSLQSRTYDARIHEAETAADAEGRRSAYEAAIRIEPENGEPYKALLDDDLSDGTFSKDEADSLTALLGYQGKHASRTIEESLRRNRKDYDTFCYHLGLAYFYYYEGAGNKILSKPWFAEAMNSSTLSSSKKERATRFHKIAEYYQNLSSEDKAGDSRVSYGDYWTDLTTLTSGDIVREDNVKTALVMYKELTYQTAAHAMEFYSAGVTVDQMEAELEEIDAHMSEDVLASPEYNADTDGTDAAAIDANIASARQTLQTLGLATGQQNG